MSLPVFVFLLAVCLLLALALLWYLDRLPLRPSSPKGAAKRSSLPHLLKPRTPDDCPACRLGSPPSLDGGTVSAPVRPWCEVKSRRGAPKRVKTEGFACPNRKCSYFGITDAQTHALVGDGKYGRAEPIQTFRCQACRTTFSARRDTPLYRLKTPSQQVAVVLSALAEGLDPSAASRVFSYQEATITTWLTRAGEHAQTLHEHVFSHLQLPYLQLDELRTRLRSHSRVLWLWLAIDPRTKILPVLHLGPRTTHLGYSPAVPIPVSSSGVVAGVLSRMSRPHHSLRVAFVQPRERGGLRLAQRYRQRTPAMAAGRTTRRWTARDVLSCPLPPISA